MISQLQEHRPALSSTGLQVFTTTPHHLSNGIGHVQVQSEGLLYSLFRIPPQRKANTILSPPF